jgi:hypothetical protein
LNPPAIEILDGKFDLFCHLQFRIKFRVRQETQHQHPPGTQDLPIQIEDDDEPSIVDGKSGQGRQRKGTFGIPDGVQQSIFGF